MVYVATWLMAPATPFCVFYVLVILKYQIFMLSLLGQRDVSCVSADLFLQDNCPIVFHIAINCSTLFMDHAAWFTSVLERGLGDLRSKRIRIVQRFNFLLLLRGGRCLMYCIYSLPSTSRSSDLGNAATEEEQVGLLFFAIFC